jgi:hypothetical protein
MAHSMLTLSLDQTEVEHIVTKDHGLLHHGVQGRVVEGTELSLAQQARMDGEYSIGEPIRFAGNESSDHDSLSLANLMELDDHGPTLGIIAQLDSLFLGSTVHSLDGLFTPVLGTTPLSRCRPS